MKASNEQISLAITLLKMGAKLDEIKKQTGLNPNQVNQIEYKYELNSLSKFYFDTASYGRKIFNR